MQGEPDFVSVLPGQSSSGAGDFTITNTILHVPGKAEQSGGEHADVLPGQPLQEGADATATQTDAGERQTTGDSITRTVSDASHSSEASITSVGSSGNVQVSFGSETVTTIPKRPMSFGNSLGIVGRTLSGRSSGALSRGSTKSDMIEIKATSAASKVDISKKLHAGNHAAWLRRVRISGTSTGVGSLFLICAGIAVFLAPDGSFLGGVLEVCGLLAATLACHMLLLAVLPSDRKAIYALAWFLAGIFVAWSTAMTVSRLPEVISSWDGETTDGKALSQENTMYGYPQWACFIIFFEVVVNEAAFLAVMCVLAHGALFLRARTLLRRIWHVFLWGDGALALSSWLAFCAGLARPSDQISQKERVWQVGRAVLALEFSFFTFALSRPSIRQLLQGWLASRGEAIGAAAALAALIAGYDIGRLEAEARNSFRHITFDRVTREVMVADAGTLAGNTKVDRSLYDLTLPARAGEVDGFISHSWHDNAETKWEGLKRWCAKFKETRGREPRLWIDKYCVDQGDLESNLRCLPVFLAGCNRLIILWGSTFHERLWCVVELFVFLTMGGKHEVITVIPVDNMNLSDIKDAVDTFTMDNVKAFSQEDRDRLLTTMESAAGGDPAPLLREMLGNAINKQRISTSSSL